MAHLGVAPNPNHDPNPNPNPNLTRNPNQVAPLLRALMRIASRKARGRHPTGQAWAQGLGLGLGLGVNRVAG